MYNHLQWSLQNHSKPMYYSFRRCWCWLHTKSRPHQYSIHAPHLHKWMEHRFLQWQWSSRQVHNWLSWDLVEGASLLWCNIWDCSMIERNTLKWRTIHWWISLYSSGTLPHCRSWEYTCSHYCYHIHSRHMFDMTSGPFHHRLRWHSSFVGDIVPPRSWLCRCRLHSHRSRLQHNPLQLQLWWCLDSPANHMLQLHGSNLIVPR